MPQPKNIHKSIDPGPKHIRREIFGRIVCLYVFFLLAFVVIVARILWLQLGPYATPLDNLSIMKSYRFEQIEAVRGSVLSDDGQLLSTDPVHYRLKLDFSRIDDSLFDAEVDALAASLASFRPERSAAQYKQQLVRTRYVAKQTTRPGRLAQNFLDTVSAVDYDRVMRMPFFNRAKGESGVKRVGLNKRFMPCAPLAQRVIMGVESAFDSQLAGSDGQSKMVYLYGGQWVTDMAPYNIEPVGGNDVVTTIDIKLQDVVHKIMCEQLKRKDALYGTAIVMECATGHVKAMSNVICNKRTGRVSETNNYAIAGLYEPGSTFKLVSFMALMEKRGFKSSTMVDCRPDAGGKYAWIGGNKFYDDHSIPVVTLEQAIVQSSNIGFVRSVYNNFQQNDVSYNQGAKEYLDFFYSLGVTRDCELQIPGAKSPNVSDPRRSDRANTWSGLSLRKMAYGYGFEITPMQMLMIYNGVANGGVLIKPLFVSRVQRPDGEVVAEFTADTLCRKMCSDATLAAAQKALLGVVEDQHGTGRRYLQNPYYKVAGKTGTAQHYMERYRNYIAPDGSREYYASFIGYFPADKPKYSCLVSFVTYAEAHSPQRQAIYGGELAGPVVSAIASHIHATDTRQVEALNDTPRPSNVDAPVKGGAAEQMRRASDAFGIRSGLPAELSGMVVSDSSAGYMSVDAFDSSVMPSVEGMGLKDALYVLESRGLSVSFTGRGEVVWQSVAAGDNISPGDQVSLRLNVKKDGSEKMKNIK